MSGINPIIGLFVLLVISIVVYINIRLFFKIWGMTNDIKEIKEILIDINNNKV